MAKKGSKPKRRGKKKHQIEVTSMGMLLWGSCLFFLMAWIFVLGILVGRGFLPGTVTAISDLKKQISKLQAMVNHKKVEDLSSSRSHDPDPKLAFYEKLSSKKDEARKKSSPTDVEADTAAVRGSTPAAEEEKASAGPLPVNGNALSRNPAAHSGVEDIQKTLAKKAEGFNRPVQEESSDDALHYTVQLASLGDRKKAEKLIARLTEKGYPAYYYEVTVKGRTYYRIRCGRFAEKGKAGEYAKKLEREAGIKGFVSRAE